MPTTQGRAIPRATTRTLATTAIAAAALTASVLTAPAALAAVTPTSLTPSLTSLTDWHQWVDPSGYDWELESLHGSDALRMSSGISNVNNYGNITQLSSPAIVEVGEPSTGAAYRVFTADFTIDAETYAAQPGLAIEVAGDKGGNRSGGGIVFRHDSANQLTLSTYWADAGSEADLEDWNNSTATIPFTGPVKIRYVVEYKVGAPDAVKVYADGVLRISGEGYEAYHEAVAAPKQTIDSLLFRTSRSVPEPDGAWTVVTPSEAERTALNGHGFFFSKVAYGASNTAFAPSTSVGVNAFITGTPVVNGQLTAGADVSVIGGATLSYQWLRSGLSIPGATGATYTVQPNDAGKRISVKVTAVKSGYATGSDTSDQTAAVGTATLTFSTPAAIAGTAKLGATLTASGATTPAATYAYQWFRNGALIKGATAKTYKLTASDVGRTMTVKVTASKAGYTTLSSTSAPTAEVAPGTLVATGVPTLSGAFMVGGNIVANPITWTSGATLKYAFYVDGDLVQLSPLRVYKPTWEDRGGDITVIIIGSMPGYASTESAESAPRGPIR